MTINEDIKNGKRTIVLGELDLPIELTDLVNSEPGIYHSRLTTGNFSFTDDSGTSHTFTSQKTEKHLIKSLQVGADPFVKCDIMPDLREQEQAFVSDLGTSDFFIHFKDFEPVLDKVVRPGSVKGFSYGVDNSRADGCKYQGIDYEPRIEKIPVITESKDPLFYGLMQFQGFRIPLTNKDGKLDNLKDYELPGQPFRLFFGCEGYEFTDFVQIKNGYVEEFSEDWNTLSLNIQDPRKKLSRSIPDKLFNFDDFPFMDESLDGERIPLVYGRKTNIPLDKMVSPKTFCVADCTHHQLKEIEEVWEDRGNGVVISTPFTGGLDGFIYIPDYNDDYEYFADIKGYCDSEGNLIENGLDVITDVMYYYGNTAYVSANYNITEWEAEKLKAENVAVYITDKIEIKELIEKSSDSLDMMFIPTTEDRYTVRSYDADREPVRMIKNEEWLTDPKSDNLDKEFLSSVEVKYDKDPATDEYKKESNYEYEASVVRKYNKYKHKDDIETLLVNKADALAKTNRIMEQCRVIKPIVKRKTHLGNIDLLLMDFLTTHHSRPAVAPEYGVYELISRSINIDKNEIEFKMKYVKPFVPVEYEIDQLVDDSGDCLIDDSGNYLIDRREVQSGN